MLDVVFLFVFEAESTVVAFLASKSYKFDQNQIFVATQFNVTREYKLENITFNNIKVAETVIFVSKIVLHNLSKFVPKFDVARQVCIG